MNSIMTDDFGMLEPQYHEAYKAWRDSPNPTTNSQILHKLNPTITKATRNYVGNVTPTNKAQAKVLTLQSLASYNPSKGPLDSHVYSNLRRLYRLAGQEGQAIKLPEMVAMQRKQLDITVNELEDTLSRQPTDQEIAEHMGISLRRLGNLRKAKKPMFESNAVYPSAAAPLNSGEIWTEFVYSDLSTIDQQIMERLLGLHGRERQTAVTAAKDLKLSPAAISKRAAKIQEKLDMRNEQSML